MSTRIVAASLVLALVTCSAARAQDRRDLWRTYAEKLPPHAIVVIQLTNGKSVRGHLVQVTDDRLVVLRKTRLPVPPLEFALADVESIEPQKPGWSPGAKVLASIGAAGGVLVALSWALLLGLD